MILTLEKLKERRDDTRKMAEECQQSGDPAEAWLDYAAVLEWAISIRESASRAPETVEAVAAAIEREWQAGPYNADASVTVHETAIAAALQREREIAEVRLAVIRGLNDGLTAELAAVKMRMSGYVESQTANEAELKRADKMVGDLRAELAKARRERDELKAEREKYEKAQVHCATCDRWHERCPGARDGLNAPQLVEHTRAMVDFIHAIDRLAAELAAARRELRADLPVPGDCDATTGDGEDRQWCVLMLGHEDEHRWETTWSQPAPAKPEREP